MSKCHTKKSFYSWINMFYNLIFHLTKVKDSVETHSREPLFFFFIIYFIYIHSGSFHLLPIRAADSVHMVQQANLNIFFALLLKPIKFTAKESSDYKAAQSSHPSSPSSVCIHVCSCVCVAPRAMLGADQVGM